MKQWLWEQIYHLNVIGDIMIVTITVTLSKMNTNKEIRTIKQEVKKDVEALRNDIRTLSKKNTKR